MVLGAFAAIGQRNIKRLMAYSSIGHMGFALVGLAAGNAGRRAGRAGLHGDLSGDDARHLRVHPGDAPCGVLVENITDLAGLARTNPAMAFFLAMLLFSLAGIPPLAGFFAKFYVFLAAIKAGLYALAVIGVLASVVGAYYYLTIVKVMYFDEPVSVRADAGRSRLVLGVNGLFVIFFIAYPAPSCWRGGRGREVIVLMHHPERLFISVTAWRPSHRLRHARLDQRGSAARARAGERGPLWITAARQTAGRGRRGNAWTSEPGNLYASLLLTDAAPAMHLRRALFRGRACAARCGRANAPQLAAGC